MPQMFINGSAQFTSELASESTVLQTTTPSVTQSTSSVPVDHVSSLYQSVIDRFNPAVFIRGHLEESIILRTDSYKVGHKKMLPHKGKTYAYLEARSGAKFQNTLFFGLQYYLCLLKRLRVTRDDIDKAERIFSKHLDPTAFDRAAWEYIVEKYDGKLPIEIYAPDEGTEIPQGNVLMVVSNTDDECYWLPTYLETFLEHIWYPCTVATISKHCKKTMLHYINATCDDAGCVAFMLHDFGGRGVNTDEGAGVGGAAHNVNFMGTDTVLSLSFVETYYLSDVCSYSVVATEHSVMTKKGRERQFEVVEELIDENPTGILSIVIDSYNLYDVLEHLGTFLKEKVLARDGKLVVRPDSGNPLEVSLEVLQILDKHFGTTLNNKNFKVLNPKVGLIYGDGINPEMIENILGRLAYYRYASSNIVFGMGGGLLQKLDRDTQRFAYKVSAFRPQDPSLYEGLIGNDDWVPIFKDPIGTEGGSKRSKSGTLILIKDSEGYKTVVGNLDDPRNVLKLRFYNGELTSAVTFDEVRETSNK